MVLIDRDVVELLPLIWPLIPYNELHVHQLRLNWHETPETKFGGLPLRRPADIDETGMSLNDLHASKLS